jgi:hypothetical protein
MYYTIRRLNTTNDLFELAKFDDRADPDEVYTVDKSRCNCPATVPNCKHKRMLTHWQRELFQVPGIALEEDMGIIPVVDIERMDKYL